MSSPWADATLSHVTSLEQIRNWVAMGENETAEFKRSTGQRTEAARAACALANHRGGIVLFGVEPDGRIVGQLVVEKTLEDIANEFARIEPPIFPVIDRVDLEGGKAVLAVTVPPGHQKPYRFAGTPYKRVGNTNRELPNEEAERVLLERLHASNRWEIEPAEDRTVGDLEVSEIVHTVEEAVRRGRLADPGTREPTELLRGLGLTRAGRILKAAVALFGKAERFLPDFPQCLLRLARFKGTAKSDFLDNRQYHGHAFDLLLRADRFLRDHLPVSGRIVPDLFERVDDPLYPPAALREAVANAICHRDYAIPGGSVGIAIFDDRLEISSPGPLHFGLRAEDLFRPHESLPWNPLIAQAFYRRGMIEMWGRGTLRMAELSRQAGLPQPEVEEVAGAVVVRFRPGRYIAPQRVDHDLSLRQRKILEILGGGNSHSLSGIQENLGEEVPRTTLHDELDLLRKLGLVEGRGHGRGAKWFLKGRNL